MKSKSRAIIAALSCALFCANLSAQIALDDPRRLALIHHIQALPERSFGFVDSLLLADAHDLDLLLSVEPAFLTRYDSLFRQPEIEALIAKLIGSKSEKKRRQYFTKIMAFHEACLPLMDAAIPPGAPPDLLKWRHEMHQTFNYAYPPLHYDIQSLIGFWLWEGPIPDSSLHFIRRFSLDLLKKGRPSPAILGLVSKVACRNAKKFDEAFLRDYYPLVDCPDAGVRRAVFQGWAVNALSPLPIKTVFDALDHDDPEMVNLAMESINRLNMDDSLGGFYHYKLLGIFFGKDDMLKFAAARPLVLLFYEKSALEYAVSQLESPDYDRRREATYLIADAGRGNGSMPEKAFELIKAMLKSPDEQLRRDALYAFSKVSGKNVRAAIIPLLIDKTKIVRDETKRILREDPDRESVLLNMRRFHDDKTNPELAQAVADFYKELGVRILE